MSFVQNLKIGGVTEEVDNESDLLPEGKACGDCSHWKRCSWLIEDREETDTYCDWTPSRFKERDIPNDSTQT